MICSVSAMSELANLVPRNFLIFLFAKSCQSYDILDTAGDQTRLILADKVTSLAIHFPESLTQGNKLR